MFLCFYLGINVLTSMRYTLFRRPATSLQELCFTISSVERKRLIFVTIPVPVCQRTTTYAYFWCLLE